jgi:hypothetical protein
MAKMSLLDIVQDIMSDMNSDQVDSISESVESLQVAKIVESVYFELMANKNWPHLEKLITLDSSGQAIKPTHMKLPVAIKELKYFNYNTAREDETRTKYETVSYLTPENFLVHTNSNNSDDTNITIVTDFSGAKVLVRNNQPPKYYTSFDDEWIVCDSYDKEVDSTLQSSKTQCFVVASPVFEVRDSFIPDMPVEAFPALLAEAKSVCFTRIKQAPDAKAEQQSTRQRAWLSRKAWRVGEGLQFPDYGRRGKRGWTYNEGKDRADNG